MNIGFVLHQFMPGYNSGTEQYVYHLARRMRSRGHEVKVFTFEPNTEGVPPFTGVRKDTYEDIPVTRLYGWMGHFPNIILSKFYNPLFGKLFADFLREEKIELVHSFQNQRVSVSVIEECYHADIPCVINLMDFWYLCPHIQLLKNNNALCSGPHDYKECIHCQAPFDATFQSVYPYINAKESIAIDAEHLEHVGGELLAAGDPYLRVAAAAMRTRMIRDTLELAGLLVSPSHFLKSVFVDNGYDPGRFELVRYGIDLEPLKQVEKKPGDTLRVGFIGTITEHKGVHTLVESIRLLEGEDRVSLEVYGSMDSFPEYAAKLRELAGDDPRIRFHGRFESPELPRVQGEIDLLVVPSLWYENTPFVILEALASGTPVITSDLGGMSELIEVGSNGLLFKPADAKDLSEKIRPLIHDRSLIENFDRNNVGVRSLDDNVDQFLGIYEGMLSKKKTESEASDCSDSDRSDGKESAMNPDPQDLQTDLGKIQKKNELLTQQTQHLTGQIFHMITMNSGLIARVNELEAIQEDQVYLVEHADAMEDPEIPRDLSPSIQKRLTQAKQIKTILHRRNNQIVELQRQIEAQRAGAEFQGVKLRERDEELQRISAELEHKKAELQQTMENAGILLNDLQKYRKFLPIRIWRGLKKLLKGGPSG